MTCDFCGKYTEEPRLILRDVTIQKKDGSDLELCSECLNNYVSGEYNKIKVKEQGK